MSVKMDVVVKEIVEKTGCTKKEAEMMLSSEYGTEHFEWLKGATPEEVIKWAVASILQPIED